MKKGIVETMAKVANTESALQEQSKVVDNLNSQLMAAVLSGKTGTAGLERKAEAAGKAEEKLKAEVAAARKELAEAFGEAEAAGKTEDEAAEKQLEAVFAEAKELRKQPKQKKKTKDAKAERKALDMQHYEKCCNRQAQKLSRKEAEAKRIERREEAARRRRENHGDGSAYLSALVFMGEEVLSDENVVEYALKVNNLKTLIDTAHDGIQLQQEQLEKMLADARELKEDIGELVLRLKAPNKSSSYRKLAKEHDELTALISNAVASINAAKAKLDALVDERVALERLLSNLKRVGNGSQKAYVRLWEEKSRKAERMSKALAPETRQAEKVEEKEHVKSFPVLTFDMEAFCKYLKQRIDEILKGWEPCAPHASDEEKAKHYKDVLAPKREKLNELMRELKADADNPFVAMREDGVVTRLPETKLTKEFGIEADTPDTKRELVVVDHKFETLLGKIPWQLWATSEKVAVEAKERAVKHLYRRLLLNGFVVCGQMFEDKYRFAFSSASHQKEEKAVFAMDHLCDAHGDYLYFGRTLEELANREMLGAAFLKAMSNRTRPEAATITLEDGTPVTVFDILPVKDVKKLYHHENALCIGGNYDGMSYKRGAVDDFVKIFDGQMAAIKKISIYGQLNGEGWKGIVYDSLSAIREFCRKYKLTVEDFYNLVIETFDGRKVRLGDYAIICGDGCWKFDKLFDSYADYENWIRKLMPTHPGIEQLGILRQLDDEEGQYKTRRLTRSLVQQWGWADNREIRRLIAREAKKLTRMKTMEGALEYLAGLNKPESERTPLERMFAMYPQLILNKNVQQWYASRWEMMKRDALANKLVTAGQYPYIIQDPVAALECWLGFKSPEDKDLGVLREGEISLNEVAEGVEVLVVRFPANFLTAKVLKCVPHKKEFESCNNCAILSIYDDVLIRQDGDVDGDEMCIIYDALAIALTKRMHSEFNPPVVIFEHGEKGDVEAPGSVRNFWIGIADALYSAHHNGQVGKYANLARDCMYCASIAFVEGNEELVETLLLWMAAASTGAILAIDQVKGNKFSKSLVDWLDKIREKVSKMMEYKQPWTQQFLDKDVLPKDCLPANDKVITDRIGLAIDKAVGNFRFDGQGYIWNPANAMAVLGIHNFQHFQVNRNVLDDEIVNTMSSYYFNSEKVKNNKGDWVPMDADFLRKVKSKKEVGLREYMVFCWHNERAMQFRMKGVLLSEAQSDYYAHVRECVKKFAFSTKKPNKLGRMSTKGELLASVYTDILCCALETKHSNGIEPERKGSFCMFCLKVIAPWMVETAEKNLGIKKGEREALLSSLKKAADSKKALEEKAIKAEKEARAAERKAAAKAQKKAAVAAQKNEQAESQQPAPEAVKAVEESYQLIGVTFDNYDKVYSYVCRKGDAKVGDTVFAKCVDSYGEVYYQPAKVVCERMATVAELRDIAAKLGYKKLGTVEVVTAKHIAEGIWDEVYSSAYEYGVNIDRDTEWLERQFDKLAKEYIQHKRLCWQLLIPEYVDAAAAEVTAG